MPKQKLFDDESEEEVEIKVENEYAKKYDQWRGKEELHKLEQKYGSKALNSDASLSSDSEDESDEPPEISEEVETQFLKTLSLLKKKDPRIYDPEFKFFDEKEKERVTKPKEKTLTFADSDDDDEDDGNIFSIEKKAEVAEDTPKETTNRNEKEGKLKDFLTGKVQHIDNTAEKDLEPLKALWSDPALNEGEAFLRDYILNKKYLEEGEEAAAEGRLRDDAELGADAALVEEQDRFERAYNFRFEEPDQEYLKRYPRTMNYIRPADERRAKKRAEVRTRKDDERTRKMEEIARMKALKLQEIQQKIARIKEVTGNQELAFKDEDIEGDFDPAEHDRRMRAIFDDQYYGDADHEKPVFPDLDKELEIENWDQYSVEDEKEAQDFADEPHCEDDTFNMDADFDPSAPRATLLEEMRRSLGKKRRGRRNKSALARLLATDKPKFIPDDEEKTYDQYMEEYYKMDCEDVIGGDLPTRFKYREVVPNDYGLTIEEILLADDKELTQWVPLKRVVRLAAEGAQRGDVLAYRQKAGDPHLKKKVLPSLFKNLPDEPELVISKEENRKKKKNRRKKNSQKEEIKEQKRDDDKEEIVSQAVDDMELNGEAVDVLEKLGTKKRKRKTTEVSVASVDNDIEVENNLEVSDLVQKQTIEVSHVVQKEPSLNKSKNKQADKNLDTTVESKADSSIDASSLTKRQKKNLRKKMKKLENAKNTPNPTNVVSAAGKKRKLSEGEPVPKKKKKNIVNNNLVKKETENKVNSEDANKNGHSDKKKDSVKKKENLKNKDKLKNKENIKKNKLKNKEFKPNKDKFNNKQHKLKNKDKKLMDKNKESDKKENAMSNLSDERLKAYGLNPKKYRGFLKYKKF